MMLSTSVYLTPWLVVADFGRKWDSMAEIGVTERGDAALDPGWLPWVEGGKPAILISKDPFRLCDALTLRHSKNLNIIVHATITGFGGTFLEPNVPSVARSITGYYALCKFLGSKRVVLRVDPVIPTEKGIETALFVISHHEPGSRVRISFIDNYDHVKERLKEFEAELPWDSFHAPLELRRKAWEELGKPEVCGEPDFECCGCVSEEDCKVLEVEPIKKSKKQRTFCSCLANKTELLTRKEQCHHGCLYCYWK
jgi:hypothetical protein